MCGEYQETETGKTLPPLKPDGHLKKLREKEAKEECQGCYNIPCTCFPDDCNVDPE